MTVELLDSMGTDLSVANAARVSFSKWHEEFEAAKDERLIGYLAKHQHWSPFSHCFASFRVTAPFFVAAQLKRHQVGLAVNEVSRRYVKTGPEFWDQDEWRLACPDKKQGSGGRLTKDLEDEADEIYADIQDATLNAYNSLLAVGVCEEQARAVLPMATLTTWIWSGSLAAWARVCNQRCKPDAQKETQSVAAEIDASCANLWPVSWAAMRS